LFNASDPQPFIEGKAVVPPDSASITVKFDEIGLSGTHAVRDLWTGENLGDFTDSFSRTINRHGAGLYRIH
jgi:hypothetical protein